MPSDTAPNSILIAVSDSGIITSSTTWSYYQFQPSAINPPKTNTSDFADFPTLGIDAFALYIGVNVFDPNTGHLLIPMLLSSTKQILLILVHFQ